MKGLGTRLYFLSMEASFTEGGLHLSEAKHMYSSLSRSSMLESKPISSSIASSARLPIHDGDPFGDPSLYHSVVGSLQYLSLIRLDITFAVNQACQFMHTPIPTHSSKTNFIVCQRHYCSWSSSWF